MKKFFFLIACLITIVSCETSQLPDVEDAVSPAGLCVEVNEVTLQADQLSLSLSFKSSQKWSMSLMNDRASSWIQSDCTSGEPGEQITLNFTLVENTDKSDRSAVLRLISGGENADVVITQKKAGSVLMSPSRMQIPKDGGNVSVKIPADQEFSYEIIGKANDWIRAVVTKSEAAGSLQFSVSQNPEKARRNGQILFHNGTLSEVVTVYQAGASGNDDIVISDRSYELSSDGEKVNVEIAYDKNTTLVVPEAYNWIQEAEQSSTNTYFLNIAPNDLYEHRIGYVLLVDKLTGRTESVSLLQWQKDVVVLARNNYDIALSGGVVDLKFAANCNYQIELLPNDVDWIAPVLQTRSMVDRLESFSVAPAAAGTDRTAVIAITCGDVRQEITVRQWACDAAISFADPVVKSRCVEMYDTDSDGELSYKEAAQVESLSGLFCEVEPVRRIDANGNVYIDYQRTSDMPTYGNEITSFDELQYFTGLKEISPFAFYLCRNLESLVLPSSVEIIGTSSFYGTIIKELALPEGIKVIESIPSTLETLIVPEGAQQLTIESSNLKSVSLPKSLDGVVAFLSTFADDVKWSGSALSADGKFIVNDEGVCLMYVGRDEACVVPEGVKMFSTTFCSVVSITSLKLPSTLDLPTDNICASFKSLKSVSGKYAASDGKSLVSDGHLIGVVPTIDSYSFPQNITSVGPSAFALCQSLREITLPQWMTCLPSRVFYLCSSLEKINNIQNVDRFEIYALYGCNKLLKRFRVPARVNYIGLRALYAYNNEGCIVEFEGLTPPELDVLWDADGIAQNHVVSSSTSVYVPDTAYEKYNSYRYSPIWPKLKPRKISELYSEPTVKVLKEGDVVTVSLTNETQYQYRLIKVSKGSFVRRISSSLNITTNITKDYYIGETEVPQGFWEALMHFNPSFDVDLDYYPVSYVTYDDCVAFAKRLSEVTSEKFRLPTEAEWDYAAYVGMSDNRIYYGATGNVYEGDATDLGLYGMVGNVGEFCQDDYEAWSGSEFTIPQANDPLVVIPDSEYKVLKQPTNLRVTNNIFPSYNGRRMGRIANASSTYGFRLVMAL